MIKHTHVSHSRVNNINKPKKTQIIEKPVIQVENKEEQFAAVILQEEAVKAPIEKKTKVEKRKKKNIVPPSVNIEEEKTDVEEEKIDLSEWLKDDIDE